MAGLKGQHMTSGLGTFGNSLIVFQFAASSFLIGSAGVMYGQLQYIAEMDLGFDRDLLVSMHVDALPEARRPRTLLRERLLANPRVEGVARAKYNVLGSRLRRPYLHECQ